MCLVQILAFFFSKKKKKKKLWLRTREQGPALLLDHGMIRHGDAMYITP